MPAPVSALWGRAGHASAEQWETKFIAERDDHRITKENVRAAQTQAAQAARAARLATEEQYLHLAERADHTDDDLASARADASSIPAYAQQQEPTAPSIGAGSYPTPKRRVNMAGEWMQGKLMPARTPITVTPMQEISSKKIQEGEAYRFATVGDVVENGFVVIPRGSP